MINRRRERPPDPEYQSLTTRTGKIGHFKLVDGKYLLHKEDGPAWTAPDGRQRWFLHGERLPCSSQKEFEKYMKMKAFW